MSLGLFFKLLHVLAAIAFFCGLVGRMAALRTVEFVVVVVITILMVTKPL